MPHQCAQIFFQERGTKGLVSADPSHRMPWFKVLKKNVGGDTCSSTDDATEDASSGCDNGGSAINAEGDGSGDPTDKKLIERSKSSIIINRTTLDYVAPFHIKHQLTDHIRVFNTVTLDNVELSHGDKVQVKKYSVHSGRFLYDQSLVETIRGRRKKSQPKLNLRHVL